MDSYLNLIAAAIAVIVVICLIIARLKIKRLDNNYFQRRWTSLQQLCADQKLWYKAVIDADQLLDEALKKSHFRGKSTGERLVAAQRDLSSNDTVWFGHKLKNKIADQNYKSLNKADTLEALSGFRQALKDLGALTKDNPSGNKNE